MYIYIYIIYYFGYPVRSSYILDSGNQGNIRGVIPLFAYLIEKQKIYIKNRYTKSIPKKKN